MMADDDDEVVVVPAWLRAGSDVFRHMVEEGGSEEEAAALPMMTLPVCALDCADGELYHRVVGAWCVPWERVPLRPFLAAWFALSTDARRALLLETNVLAKELDVDRWAENLLERDDADMMAAAADAAPDALLDALAALSDRLANNSKTDGRVLSSARARPAPPLAAPGGGAGVRGARARRRRVPGVVGGAARGVGAHGAIVVQEDRRQQHVCVAALEQAHACIVVKGAVRCLAYWALRSGWTAGDWASHIKVRWCTNADSAATMMQLLRANGCGNPCCDHPKCRAFHYDHFWSVFCCIPQQPPTPILHRNGGMTYTIYLRVELPPAL